MRHRVHVFQMAGIEAERNMQPRAIGRLPIAAGAHVVFHVAATMPPFRIRVFELAEDVDRLLADDVGQHVQPAAMGHGHHDFDNAVAGGRFECQIQEWDQRFGAFERKRLAPKYFLRTNSSKITASVSRVRMRSWISRGGDLSSSPCSIRC